MRFAKKITGFVAGIILFINVNAQPVITGFSPASGLIGTTVIINGNNFSTTPSANIVMFGYARATVSASSATSITVKVPRGATLLPISVTVGQLTATSAKPFNVTSAACNALLANTSFDSIKSFPAGSGSWMIAAGDLDGDGKTDLAYGNYETGSSVTVHRNNSTPGHIDLDPKVDYFSGAYPDDAVIADFDGDSKPDLVVTNSGDAVSDISIFRNTGSPGSISFAPRVGINTGVVADKLTVGDLDNDGKPDLIITFSQAGNLCVLKNISTVGNIAFAAALQFPSNYPGFASVGDIDADGKADIVVSNFYENTISVLRNTSTGAGISFDVPVTFPAGNSVHGNAIADFDADGKPDIVTVGISSTFVSVFINNSSAGNISFAPRVDYSIAPSRSYNVAVDDLDGDLKPDIALSSSYGISVMKNTSTAGNLSFAQLLKYPLDAAPYISFIADMDNDGKPDLIGGMGPGSMSTPGPRTVSILRNRLCEETSICPNGGGPITANIIGDTYQWQLNTGSGFFNLVNNSNYSGTNSNQLMLMNMASVLYGYQYRCLVDGIPTSITTMKFSNSWLGTISNQWENPANWSCGSVPDINTDVLIPSGTVLLSSNTTIHSLSVSTGAIITIATGITLTITH